jgi:hypothetical protein
MMQKNKIKIAISTTVSNSTLFKKSIETFPHVDCIYVVDGTQGVYGIKSITFLLGKLKNKNIDWLLLCDEDVFFTNQKALQDLIDYLHESNYQVCGMRDGGMLQWRDKNPYLINPFFCALNLKSIYKKYNKKEMLNQAPIKENEFNDSLEDLEYSYDKSSVFEEYYCFFLWLRRNNFKFKFLEGKSNLFDNDSETTAVYNHNNILMLYHTWYARTYGIDNHHTSRIDNIIVKGNLIQPLNQRKIETFVDRKFNNTKKLKRLFRKIKQRLKL